MRSDFGQIYELTGTLIEKRQERLVGSNKDWPVLDFIVSYDIKKNNQVRMFQAVKVAIRQVEKCSTGDTVRVLWYPKGRMTSDGKVFNLDEAIEVTKL